MEPWQEAGNAVSPCHRLPLQLTSTGWPTGDCNLHARMWLVPGSVLGKSPLQSYLLNTPWSLQPRERIAVALPYARSHKMWGDPSPSHDCAQAPTRCGGQRQNEGFPYLLMGSNCHSKWRAAAIVGKRWCERGQVDLGIRRQGAGG